MKYLLTLTFVLISITATAQETSTTYEASLDHFSASYNYTEDNVLYASVLAGHKDNTYIAGRLTLVPFSLSDRIFNIMELEPFIYFEWGYNGDGFINYGYGVRHKITNNFSVSASYSQWGVSASITIM